MPDSRRELLLKAMQTALSAASVTLNGETTARPAGLEVHRHLTRDVSQTSLPDITVYYAGETLSTALRGATDESERAVRVRLRVRAKAAPGQTGDEAIDPVLAWAEVAVRTDYTFGGVAAMTELEMIDALTAREYADTYAEVTMQFVVTLQTKWLDPRQAP
jgi:hypothetical protein